MTSATAASHILFWQRCLAAMLVALIALPAAAADFYAGKSLKLAVSSDAGGGYDLYTRILARHIARYIPGAPATIVQNFPGAGGLRGAHYVYQTASKDGTEFGEIHATTMLDAILGRSGEEIDATKYAWIGSIASDSDVCSFWKTNDIRSFDDMLTKPTMIGSVGKGDQATTFPTVINNVLGTKMKIVMGYKGTGDRLLAIERGELTGSCGINASTLMSVGQKQIEDGLLIPVVQSGLTRQRGFPDVPLTQSFAKTDEQRLILETIFSQMQIARAYAAPPGVPAERVAILRTAFWNTVNDADFKADAEKAKVEISPLRGEDVQQLIAKLAAISGDLKSKVAAALGD
jgi:tripartite-type tricarboxylate transporter receptor subunit TctC